MTHLRFRHKPLGNTRRRCRNTARQSTLLILSQTVGVQYGFNTTALQSTMPAAEPVLRIGDYVVGAEGDPQLSGHPNIRY